ncbi:hypothetical protein [Massilia sp. LjRoot122]|uniref:hypothetical protein n=1 Tax=Massilia sp. LjRoot122 TaxID=3342257 RepID=UPI003ED0E35F
MNRSLILIPFFAFSSLALAQDQLKVGELLDLEERILIKKMTDELAKPNPNAPAAPPIVISPRAPKIVYPTETLAIYGTSTTYYEGQLSMEGRIHTVRNGSVVRDYVVSSIGPQGIWLTKTAGSAKGKKGRAAEAQKVTLFAPLAVR